MCVFFLCVCVSFDTSWGHLWFFSSNKGSYGVVKLAYNEDDNTYYVSQTLSHIMDLYNVLIVPAAPIPIQSIVSVSTATFFDNTRLY